MYPPENCSTALKAHSNFCPSKLTKPPTLPSLVDLLHLDYPSAHKLHDLLLHAGVLEVLLSSPWILLEINQHLQKTPEPSDRSPSSGSRKMQTSGRNYLPHHRVCQDVLDFRVLHSFVLHKGGRQKEQS